MHGGREWYGCVREQVWLMLPALWHPSSTGKEGRCRSRRMHLLQSSGATPSQPQHSPSLPELTINPCVETAPSAWPTAHLHPFEELSRSIVLSWEAATQSNCGKHSLSTDLLLGPYPQSPWAFSAFPASPEPSFWLLFLLMQGGLVEVWDNEIWACSCSTAAQPSDNLHVQPTEALEWGQLSFPGLVQTYHDIYLRGHRHNLSIFKNSAASQGLPWLCIMQRFVWLHLKTCTEPWLGLESALPLAGL